MYLSLCLFNSIITIYLNQAHPYLIYINNQLQHNAAQIDDYTLSLFPICAYILLLFAKQKLFQAGLQCPQCLKTKGSKIQNNNEIKIRILIKHFY